MNSTSDAQPGPLSSAESAELDALPLSALERHHLRLLAHALRTLQTMLRDQDEAQLDPGTITAWLVRQPAVADEPEFAVTLGAQLQVAGQQLQQLAAPLGRSILELELDDLIGWALRQAGPHLASGPPTTPQPPPTPPPADR